LSYEEAKKGVSHYIEEPLQEKGTLTPRSFYFAGTPEVLELFSVRPIGIWAAQREGTLSKGLVPDHLVTFFEGLAKSKGLV
jgi:hypothetical protein